MTKLIFIFSEMTFRSLKKKGAIKIFNKKCVRLNSMRFMPE
jgi:hypothetical protein